MKTREEFIKTVYEKFGGLTRLNSLSAEELKEMYELYCQEKDLIIKSGNFSNQAYYANANARNLINKAYKKISGGASLAKCPAD